MENKLVWLHEDSVGRKGSNNSKLPISREALSRGPSRGIPDVENPKP